MSIDIALPPCALHPRPLTGQRHAIAHAQDKVCGVRRAGAHGMGGCGVRRARARMRAHVRLHVCTTRLLNALLSRQGLCHRPISQKSTSSEATGWEVVGAACAPADLSAWFACMLCAGLGVLLLHCTVYIGRMLALSMRVAARR